MTFERETEPYAKSRDEKVTRLLKSSGLGVHCYSGHTLWDLDWLRSRYTPPEVKDPKDISASQFLGVPMTYQAFRAHVNKVAPQGPPKPLPGLDAYIKSVSPPDLEGLAKSLKEMGASVGAPATLKEFGLEFVPSSQVGADLPAGSEYDLIFPGGETEAMSRLKRQVSAFSFTADQ